MPWQKALLGAAVAGFIATLVLQALAISFPVYILVLIMAMALPEAFFYQKPKLQVDWKKVAELEHTNKIEHDQYTELVCVTCHPEPKKIPPKGPAGPSRVLMSGDYNYPNLLAISEHVHSWTPDMRPGLLTIPQEMKIEYLPAQYPVRALRGGESFKIRFLTDPGVLWSRIENSASFYIPVFNLDTDRCETLRLVKSCADRAITYYLRLGDEFIERVFEYSRIGHGLDTEYELRAMAPTIETKMVRQWG